MEKHRYTPRFNNAICSPTHIQPSTSQPQKKQKLRKSKRKDTQETQPSDPIINLADEALNEESVPTHYNDPLLSGEDSIQLKELMDFCTKLQQRVIDLKNTKTAQAQETSSLKKRVKRLEKKKRVKKQKKDDEDERLLLIFKQIHINMPFLEAMIHMPKGAMVLKDLLSHKEKLEKATSLVKLRRPFLVTARAVIDVHEGKLSLRVRSETITFNIRKSMKSKHSHDDYFYYADHTAKLVQEQWVNIVNHDGKWVEEEKDKDSNEVHAVSFYPRTEPVEPLEWKALENRLKPSCVEPPIHKLRNYPNSLSTPFSRKTTNSQWSSHSHYPPLKKPSFSRFLGIIKGQWPRVSRILKGSTHP
nr:hypothetical protein [Tanacetum cinerariifolium]